MSRILVVGGAGYIGSHMMKALTKAGHEPVAFDNLSTGHADAVIYGELVEGDLANRDQVADAGRAKAELSWSPRRDRLSQIVGDARNFAKRTRIEGDLS